MGLKKKITFSGKNRKKRAFELMKAPELWKEIKV